MFHNFENYDSHLILQEIEEHDFKINVIKKINELYYSTTQKEKYLKI